MAESRPSGWTWLAAAPAPPGSDELALAFARCFGSGDGARVLGHLRALTLERSIGPEAPDTALRHLEGQRQLVLVIQSLIARGRARPAPEPAAPTDRVPSF